MKKNLVKKSARGGPASGGKYSLLAGGIVVNAKGLVAVVNQNHTAWSLPKGGIEKGETPLHGAFREIHEETGITRKDLKKIRRIGTYTRTQISKSGKGFMAGSMRRITFFLFTTAHTGKLTPHDPENPSARWVRPEKVAGLLTHPKDKKFFRKHLKAVKKLIEK